MATVTFDTHELIKKLEAAGASEALAEAITSAVHKSHEASDVATKADLRELALQIDARFEKNNGEMPLLKWMMGILLAGTASLVLKTFF